MLLKIAPLKLKPCKGLHCAPISCIMGRYRRTSHESIQPACQMDGRQRAQNRCHPWHDHRRGRNPAPALPNDRQRDRNVYSGRAACLAQHIRLSMGHRRRRGKRFMRQLFFYIPAFQFKLYHPGLSGHFPCHADGRDYDQRAGWPRQKAARAGPGAHPSDRRAPADPD